MATRASISQVLTQMQQGSRAQVLAQYAQFVESRLKAEAMKSPGSLLLNGQKVYSQNDEDGIVLEILSRIGIRHRTFFEIGVGNGLENNTLFWLKQQWKGVWIDGSSGNSEFIHLHFERAMEDGLLVFKEAMVNAENIDGLVLSTGFAGSEVDLLSIDIDGNDYYVFDRLSNLSARLVVIEYNAKFPPPVTWRIPYDPDYMWSGSDWFGASLQSMNELFERKGYVLVACNMTGSNAFFVKRDLVEDRFPFAGDVRRLYQPPRYFLTGGYYAHVGGHPASNLIDCET